MAKSVDGAFAWSSVITLQTWGGGGLRARLWPCGVLLSRMAACWPKSDGLLLHSASSRCRALHLGSEGGPQLRLAAVKSTWEQVQ